MSANDGFSLRSEYWSKNDCAKEIGKGPRTLDRWHLERIGPPRTRIGRSIYYKKTALAKWLEDRTDERN